jgi:hypothetical protein
MLADRFCRNKMSVVTSVPAFALIVGRRCLDMGVDERYWDRTVLYDEVWSVPMWTLAGSYGLSDVGLAKVCRKL